MVDSSGINNPTSVLGVRATQPPQVYVVEGVPPTSFAPIGIRYADIAFDRTNSDIYMYAGKSGGLAQWYLAGGPSSGLVSLTGDSGGAITPVGGNIDVLGTANQISVIGTAGTLTISVPSAFIAPGSIQSTTSLTVGNGLTVTAGGATVSAGNIVATLGNITASAGNIAATLGSVSAGTTVTAGTDIAATAGNVLINGSAKQLRVKGGAATDFIGTATLVAGEATILNTNIAAGDRIFVERSAVNASTALGVFKVVKNAGVSFVITACKPADGTTETNDVSSVEYFIVRQV